MVDTLQSLTLIAFVFVALLLFCLETYHAIRLNIDRPRARLVSNVGLFLLGNLISGVLIPIGIVAVAAQRPAGLLASAPLPDAVSWLVTFLVLDCWRYWEHRLLHRAPWLWRLHLVHHTDTQVDVTTTERHHPMELIVGTASMAAIVLIFGLPATGIALYLLVAAMVSLWTHTNLRIPNALDRLARRIVVTPAVHAIHHSAFQPQTDSNYATVLTVWDRWFGTYTDPERSAVQKFGLSYFCNAEDARLWRVLQQPFLDQSASSEARPAAAPSGIAAMPAAWHRPLAFGAVGTLAVSAVMWPAWIDLAAAWSRQEAFQWGWLVLPLLVYLLGWHRRADVRALTPQPDWTGLLPGAVAAGSWWVSELMNLSVGRELALVLALQSVAMSMLGWRNYWRLFPALALLFLMIPLADLLQPALRMVTLEGVELFMNAARLPHTVEGFVVLLDGRRYIIADECSGLAYVSLGMFAGYAFGLMLYRSFRKVIALSLYGVGLGIVCNLVRVGVIVWVDWINGSQMDLAAHGSIQWIGMLTVLALLLLSVSRLDADPRPAPAPAPALADVAAGRWLAPSIVGLLVIIIVGVGEAAIARPDASMNVSGHPTATTARAAHPPALPEGWKRGSDTAVWNTDPGGLTESLRLSYERGSRLMTIRVIQTLSAEAKLPRLGSGDTMPGAWREAQTRTESVCHDSGCSSALHSILQRSRFGLQQEMYAAYGVGQLVSASTLAARADHAWNRIRRDEVVQRSITVTFDAASTPTSTFDEVEPVMRALNAALTVDARRL